MNGFEQALARFLLDNGSVGPPILLGAAVGAVFAYLTLGMILCFLGYVFCRVELPLSWMILGGFAGAVGLSLLAPTAPGWAYLPVCFVLAAGLGAGAWLGPRIAFGALVLILTPLAVVAALGRQPTGVDWGFGLIAGACLGTLGFLFMKQVFIAFTGLLGAAVAVLCGALIADAPTLAAVFDDPGGHAGAAALLVGITLGIAAAGGHVQVRLTQRYRIAPVAEAPRRKGPARAAASPSPAAARAAS